MPGEFEPHAGTWMAWPRRPDNWRDGAGPARGRVRRRSPAGSPRSEPVTVAAHPDDVDDARARLGAAIDGRADPVRRRLDARHRPDVRGRRHRSAPRVDWDVQRVGRRARWALRVVGPRRRDGRRGVRGRGRRPLPRADRAARAARSTATATARCSSPSSACSRRTATPTSHATRSSACSSRTRARRRSCGSASVWSPTRPTGTSTTSRASCGPGVVVLTVTDDPDDPQYRRSLDARRRLEAATSTHAAGASRCTSSTSPARCS